MVFAALAVRIGSTLLLEHLLIVISVFNGVPSSCFPSSTGLGSSFDVDLALKVGAALGDESRAKGIYQSNITRLHILSIL